MSAQPIYILESETRRRLPSGHPPGPDVGTLVTQKDTKPLDTKHGPLPLSLCPFSAKTTLLSGPPILMLCTISFRPGATGGLQSPPMTNHPPAPTLNIQPPLYHGQGERSKDIFAAHAAQRAEEQRKKQARAARTTGINFGTGTPSLPPRRQSP